MTCAVLGQGRRPKVSARLVRRRRTEVVAVYRVAKKQKEIEVLGMHHIEDRVSGSATPATPLAAQIATPGKGHRHMTLHIGERRELPLRRHSCLSRCPFTPLRAGKYMPSISCGRCQPLKRNRQGKVRFLAGREQRRPCHRSDGCPRLRQAIPGCHRRPLDLYHHRPIGPQPKQCRLARHIPHRNPLRQQICRNGRLLGKGTPRRKPLS